MFGQFLPNVITQRQNIVHKLVRTLAARTLLIHSHRGLACGYDRVELQPVGKQLLAGVADGTTPASNCSNWLQLCRAGV